MPNIRAPRKGSMEYWPRKRAKRPYARVRSYAPGKDVKPQAFAGYKVGMTHIMMIDNVAKSDTKGQEISCPVTIIECPPLKSFSARFYKKTIDNLKLVSEICTDKPNKELERTISLPKKVSKKVEDIKDFDVIRILVYTQPRLTGIGKKKPEIFEIPLSGKKEEDLKWVSENLGKEINIRDVFKEGQQLDVHSISKGQGYQGPVKRFGVALKRHKSEKGIRRVGGRSGAWVAYDHMMHRVAQPGQTGYHQRMEHNKLLIKIGDKEPIATKGGFFAYGVVKNTYILLKGSVAGTKKRMIILSNAIRPSKFMATEAPTIKYIDLKK